MGLCWRSVNMTSIVRVESRLGSRDFEFVEMVVGRTGKNVCARYSFHLPVRMLLGHTRRVVSAV